MRFQSRFCSLIPKSQFSPNIWTNDVDNRECKVNEQLVTTGGDYMTKTCANSKNSLGIAGRLLIRGLIVIAASVGIALCIKGTVCSMDRGERGRRAAEAYCKEAEREYVVKVKRLLSDRGYANAGVMLTKVYTEEGGRDYTLSINHRRFKSDSDANETLKEALTLLAPPVEDSAISIMTTS